MGSVPFHAQLLGRFWCVNNACISRTLLRVNAHSPQLCTQNIKNLVESDSIWDTAKVPTHPALRSVGGLITKHAAF